MFQRKWWILQVLLEQLLLPVCTHPHTSCLLLPEGAATLAYCAETHMVLQKQSCFVFQKESNGGSTGGTWTKSTLCSSGAKLRPLTLRVLAGRSPSDPKGLPGPAALPKAPALGHLAGTVLQAGVHAGGAP